jgi:GT2 family glycosyltransferase
MIPVLILTHNCLELTKKCVASVLAQDVETDLLVIDNASTDGSREWLLQTLGVGRCWPMPENKYVSKPWNIGLRHFFQNGAEHVCVINNDTILPPNFCRELASTGSGFVTGVSWWDLKSIMSPENCWHGELTDGPDFSAFLIRRELYEKVGPFNEDMAIYCSDVDYDIRARRLGITLNNSHVKFYHERSSTLKQSIEKDKADIQAQANVDHLVFQATYGMMPGEQGYERLWQVEDLAKR